MSILIVLFGLLSDCLLSVLVGIIGSSRRIGFGLAFLVSLSSRRSWGLSSPC